VLHNTTAIAGSYYHNLKSYSQYSKRALETVEEYAVPLAHASFTTLDTYSRQPLIEGLLTRADAFGNQQLDKIEEGIHKIKETAPKALQSVESKLHGTKIEGVLIRTITQLDHAVDVLFPETKEAQAQEEATSDQQDVDSTTASIIEASAPVYNKMRTRISKESVLRLPAHLKILANQHPSAYYILQTKQKGVELSKSGIENVQKSLGNVTLSVTSLLNTLKHVNATEVRASAAELLAMSKDGVSKFADKNQFSKRLIHASAVISRQLEAGYVRIADIESIKHILNSLGYIVNASPKQ
jgi:hypothetical protein